MSVALTEREQRTYVHTEHPILDSAFDEETRRALLAEDATAWRNVCSVLIAIVTMGLLLGLFAVSIAV